MIFSKIKNIKQTIRNVWCKGDIRYQSTQKPAPGAVMLSHNTLEPRSLTEPLGPPLLILHGLMGSKQNWRQISKQIHNGMNHARKIILLDNRNHGMSPRTTHHSQKLMVEDVYQMIRILQLNKPVLLGHSLGGSTMMFLALLYPELVSGLIVVEISPRTHILPQRLMHQILPILKNSKLEATEKNLQKVKRRVYEELASKIKDKPTLDFLMQNLYKDDDGKIKWRLNLETLGQSKVEKFPHKAFQLQYPGPCLFLGGQRSEFLKESDLPDIRKMFPRAEMQILQSASHLLLVENPKEFVNVITQFLNETLSN
ncbi:protein ABHD11-like [Ctenocephalides felis]|uniref:protein ABHD11-like n=1 Tax=Ctenocephalides felis TaxID=7515 RepID=UPI000E6E3045|nr:protein ABHD11-like [Ctenocephalides felis]